MHAFLTVRKLKPGNYDDWRRAWEPDEWPPGAVRAYILRNLTDPDEVIAFGFYEDDPDELLNDPKLREQQQTRFERMEPFVAETGTDGVYEVIDEVLAHH